MWGLTNSPAYSCGGWRFPDDVMVHSFCVFADIRRTIICGDLFLILYAYAFVEFAQLLGVDNWRRKMKTFKEKRNTHTKKNKTNKETNKKVNKSNDKTKPKTKKAATNEGQKAVFCTHLVMRSSFHFCLPNSRYNISVDV